MSHIEDEYKKRFSDQELNNDGFDSEDLWNSISKDIHPEEPNARKVIPFTFLLLLIGMGIIGGIYWNAEDAVMTTNSDSKLNNEVSVESANKIDIDKATAISENATKKDTKTSKYNNIISATQKNIITDNSPISKAKADDKIQLPQLNNNQNTTNKSTASSSADSYLNKNQLSNTSKKIISTLTQNFEFNSSKNDNENRLESSLQNEHISSKQNQLLKSKNTDIKDAFTNLSVVKNQDIPKFKNNTTTLSFLPINLVPLIWQNNSSHNLTPTDPILAEYSNSKDKDSKRANKWNIGIFGGINTFTPTYKSNTYNNLVRLKEQTEKGILGTNFGMNVSYLFKNKWVVQSGLEYHQLQSKFEYRSIRNIDILLENQVVTIWEYPASGNEIVAFGDTTVSAVETRNVRHYNKIHKFSIPIEVGWQTQKSKWMLGITGGINFNFITAQSGRMLNKNEEIIDFDNNTSAKYLNAFNIGYRISPYVGYQLSDKFRLNFQPRLTAFTHKNFDGSDIKIEHQQIELNLGAVYQW